MHPVEILLFPLGRALRGRRADATASIANAPELASDNRIALTSPSFGEGQEIPAKHCGQFIGEEISPALTWDTLPAGTKDLLLVFEDLDVPIKTPAIHTIAAFAPTDTGLAEGALTPKDPGIRFLPNRIRQTKYVGPRPLPGHGPHHYRFHLYALDTPVDFATCANTDQLRSSVKGHVLARGTLTGTRKC